MCYPLNSISEPKAECITEVVSNTLRFKCTNGEIHHRTATRPTGLVPPVARRPPPSPINYMLNIFFCLFHILNTVDECH